MEPSNVVEVFKAYGAAPEVLAEYGCVALRARIVADVLKIRTPAGTRALRKLSGGRERAKEVFACTEYAAHHGLERVPRWIRTIYDDPYVVHPSGLYAMTVWVPGRAVNLRRSEELLEASRLLATWHRAVEGFRPEGGWSRTQPSLVQQVRESAVEMSQLKANLTEHGQLTLFDKLFLACVDELVERLHAAAEALDHASIAALDEEAMERGWVCHGDFRRRSVRFDGERYVLVDFDHVHPGHPLYDLSQLLQRVMPVYQWRTDMVESVLEAYTSVFGAAANHLPALSALLAIPFRTLQIVSSYYQGERQWDDEDYVDALESALELEEAREEARLGLMPAAQVPALALTSTGVPQGTTVVAGAGAGNGEGDGDAAAGADGDGDGGEDEGAGVDGALEENGAEPGDIRFHMPRAVRPKRRRRKVTAAGQLATPGAAGGATSAERTKKGSSASARPGLKVWGDVNPPGDE
ncbi:phosphotransferase [Alicyclobacillus cycloheptanicus]|uniref:CotS family spore coat protein n=1 Tax=Alicyclobacillus cycloheptanicus TaxID=1457 RepID=A0ABT9XEW9_9BACL|nr:phosphotransferase [Alicyclobacillus cycloheptanicus]MDQ0188296.1 CotS family spore coat protein [Alicyclobacillus cycloheptanicus]WDM01012.1 phosphotransferase [Alicyclobacillus cycloheptanicus]